MKTPIVSILALGLAALFAAGCTTSAPVPRVAYPVTYEVPIGNTQVTSNTGPQNLSVNATQQVDVVPGRPLYYQVIAPVEVAVAIYEGRDAVAQPPVGQMQGTTFAGSVTPRSETLQFVFAAAQPNSRGTITFTLSDRPIAR